MRYRSGYRSGEAATATANQENNGKTTSELEKEIFASKDISPSSRFDVTRGELRAIKSSMDEIGLESYTGAKGAIYRAANILGITSVRKRVKSLVTKLEHDYVTLNSLIDKYQKMTRQNGNRVAEVEQTQTDAGLLMSRYDRTIEEMGSALDRKKDELVVAMQNAEQNPEETSYHDVQRAMMDIRADMETIRRKRDRAAMKVVTAEQSIKTYRNVDVKLRSDLKKCEKAALVAEQRLDFARVTVDTETDPFVAMDIIQSAFSNGTVLDDYVRKITEKEMEATGKLASAPDVPFPQQGDDEAGGTLYDRIKGELDAEDDLYVDQAMRILEGKRNGA